METTIRFATKQDTEKITDYLKRAKLGTEGVAENIEYFLVIEDEACELKATLGIQPDGSIGLLRSLAMSPTLKETDILVLFNKMLLLAKGKALSTIYLATDNSGSKAFFSIVGFETVEREALPPALLKLTHVKNILNVDNSVFMRLKL